jgi:hypothetical protein
MAVNLDTMEFYVQQASPDGPDANFLWRLDFLANTTSKVQIKGDSLTSTGIQYNKFKNKLLAFDLQSTRLCEISLDGNCSCGSYLNFGVDLNTGMACHESGDYCFFLAVPRTGKAIQSLFRISRTNFTETLIDATGWEKGDTINSIAWTGKESDPLVVKRDNGEHFMNNPDYGYVYKTADIGTLTLDGHFTPRVRLDCKQFGPQGCSFQPGALHFSAENDLISQELFMQNYLNKRPFSAVQFHKIDWKTWKILDSSPFMSNASFILGEIDVAYSWQ